MADREFRDALDDLERGPAASEEAEPAASGAVEAEPTHASVAALRARFGDAILRHEVQSGDEHVVFVPAERVVEILGWLRDDAAERYDFLQDVTAVDYGGGRPLQVVYQLYSIEHRHQLRVKAELALDALEVDSVVPLWSTANWLEREVFDLFGIRFRGHPDLRRILMPQNYAEGHPLRKDFPLRGRFSRVEQTRRALALAIEDHYTPEELRFARPGPGTPDADAEAGAVPESAGTGREDGGA